MGMLVRRVLPLLCAWLAVACQPSSTPGEAASGTRGLVVSMGEDQVQLQAAWKMPLARVQPGEEAAALAAAEAAMARGDWYQNASSALPLLYAVLRHSPGHPAATALRESARQGVLAQGEAIVQGLPGETATLEEAKQVVAVLQALGDDSAEAHALQQRIVLAERLQSLVAHGYRELAAGNLGENGLGAYAAFNHALRARPDDVRARQGMQALETAMISRAKAAIARDEFRQAATWLTHAARLRPESPWVVDEARRQFQARREARVEALHVATLKTLQSPHAHGALQRARGQIDALARVAEDNDWRVQRLEARLALARRYGLHRPGERFADALMAGGRAPPMVVVPHGAFMMGAPRDEEDSGKSEWPQHQVTFQRGFAMARTETTVADYARFVAATGHRSRAERRGYSVVYDELSGNFVLRNNINWRHDYRGKPASPQLPVLHVDIQDALAYANWLSEQTGQPYRLPSEAEFEYALRAGSQARFPWGGQPPGQVLENLTGAHDTSPSGRTWGNAFAGYRDGHWGPAPAGSFPANGYGLHDMGGNVSEWVMDCWHQGYRRAPADGDAWYNPGCRRRMVRGASWSSAPSQARAAWRMSQAHDITNARTGFRVVRDI